MSDTVMPIEVVPTQTTCPTARVELENGQKIWLHSAYDPTREAASFVANYPLAGAGAVIVLGLGLGYHVAEIQRLTDGKTPLLVVEAEERLLKLARKHNSNLSWKQLVVDSQEQGIMDFINKNWESYRQRDLILVEHPPSLRISPEYYTRMRHRIRDYLNELGVCIISCKVLNPWIQLNVLTNLPMIIDDPGVELLKNTFHGRPAVIVAAGPSLNKNIHLLPEVRGKGVTICVGTALKALLSRDIQPDLVVGIDPTEANYRVFADLKPTDAFLCYEPQIHWKIPPLFAGRRLVFNSFNENLQVWLKKLYGSKGQIEPGGSVAIAAFDIACLLGCDPIVFIGQDLAYTNGLTHATGTVYEGRQVPPLLEKRFDFMKIPAVGGGTVWTGRGMYSALVCFERLFAKHQDRLIIDATEGGALKRGTRILTFQQAIEQYFTKEIPLMPMQIIKERLQQNAPHFSVRERVRRELEKTAREYKRLIADIEDVLSLTTETQALSNLAKQTEKLSILKNLRDRAIVLNNKTSKVSAQTKLTQLISLLTIDVDLLPLLPDNATTDEQIERIALVHRSYLKAAQVTRQQFLDAAGFIRSGTETDDNKGINVGNQ